MAKQQQGESSLALPVTYTIFTLGFSHSAWAGSRNGSPSLLLAALLGLQDLALSQPVRQHSTSQALETTRSLQGSSLLFCLTLTGRMNTPLLPPALLSYPTPLGTVPAGLGHCDFSLLSYSRSLSLCVCSYKHTLTQSIYLPWTLPLNPWQQTVTTLFSFLSSPPPPLPPLSSNPFSNSRSTGYDIMSGCWG